MSITFVNGIVHKFAYKEIAQQKIRTREKFLYLSFEPMLLEYLEEHQSITRKDVEKLTGLRDLVPILFCKNLWIEGS